jgi:hypothetical protein
MKVDKGAILREDLTAVEHLKLWLLSKVTVWVARRAVVKPV